MSSIVFVSVAISMSFFTQMSSHLSATREQCMFSIMRAQWEGPDLQGSLLWNQVRSKSKFYISAETYLAEKKASKTIVKQFFKCFFLRVFAAPTAGPSVEQTVEGKQVRVTWAEIPRGQHGGCLTNYNIYLENQGHRKHCKNHLSVLLTDTWYI